LPIGGPIGGPLGTGPAGTLAVARFWRPCWRRQTPPLPTHYPSTTPRIDGLDPVNGGLCVLDGPGVFDQEVEQKWPVCLWGLLYFAEVETAVIVCVEQSYIVVTLLLDKMREHFASISKPLCFNLCRAPLLPRRCHDQRRATQPLLAVLHRVLDPCRPLEM
jgi:hypothetical protein